MAHAGCSPRVWEWVNQYPWPRGEKHCRLNPKPIGLEENLRQCGNLTQQYGSVIVLEDDCLVAPSFYTFAQQALNFYSKENSVAQISLYQYDIKPNIPVYWHRLHSEYASYFVQKTSTYGQAYTHVQWEGFNEFLRQPDRNAQINHLLQKGQLPSKYQRYGVNNWELQHNAYMVLHEKGSVWPRLSLSSNQGVVGTHHKTSIDSGLFQTPMLPSVKTFALAPIGPHGLWYDPYAEVHPGVFANILELHGIAPDQTEIDLWGTKPLSISNKPYWLTSKPTTEAIARFGMDLKPLETNILWQFPGQGLSLSKATSIQSVAWPDHLAHARSFFSHHPDVGLWPYLRYKWLKYVDRKRHGKR
jgi:hypothetical protein